MKEKLVGLLLLVPLVDSVRSVPADNLSVKSQYGSVKKVIAQHEPHFIDSLWNVFSETIAMTIALSRRSKYDSLIKIIAQGGLEYALHLIEKLNSLRNYFPADRLVMTLSLLQSWVRSSYLLPKCFTPTDTSVSLVLVSASPLIGIDSYHFHQLNLSLEYFHSTSKWSKLTILLPLVNSLFTEKNYE